MEGPSNGSSGQGGHEHFFLAAPSSLFLLLFRFIAVSIAVSDASGVVGTVVGVVLTLAFLLDEALIVWIDVCSVMSRGMGSVVDNAGESGSAFLAGEAVVVFFGDFFFFLVTSVQPSSGFLGGWT